MPFALGWLMWRSLKQTSHADRWGERFGSSPFLPPNEAIWLHAASVGEVRAAAPLINALHHQHPQRPLLVTCFTASGRAQAQRLFAGRVMIAQLPYDLGFCVRRWLNCTRPVLGIILETEIWPNLFAACGRRQLPLLMVSARLSERALRRYRWFRGLAKRSLAEVRMIAAQTPGDAEYFRHLGVAEDRLQVSGNLKFDVQFPDTLLQEGQLLRTRLFAKRTVIVAGSTHENEEATVLQAFQILLEKQPDCVLVLAPRHPERAQAVAELVKSQGLTARRRSSGEAALNNGEVLVLDSLGELTHFYAAADLVFVGGSLVPVGGHNLLEPAALSLPVIAGSHLDNVRDIAELLKDAGGLIVVMDAKTLAEAFVWLVGNKIMRRRIGQAAQQTVATNRGALTQTLALVEKQLAR